MESGGADTGSEEHDLLKELFKMEKNNFVCEVQQPRKKKRKTGGRVKGVKNGSSCHHCKRSGRLLCYCTNHVFVGRSTKARPCTKKYCIRCLSRVYAGMFQEEIDNDRFVCPACKGICSCAACRRKEMKRRLRADGIDPEKMKQAKEIAKTQAPNIEFLQKGGMDQQREQASNLLSVLADKPRARKVIRAAMEMKFTDRNNKVLYVAHIVRQVLRLDIDQYYTECEERQEKEEVERLMQEHEEQTRATEEEQQLAEQFGVDGSNLAALEKLQRLQHLLSKLKDSGVPIPDNVLTKTEPGVEELATEDDHSKQQLFVQAAASGAPMVSASASDELTA